MKVLSICTILTIQVALAIAQAPQQFSFQGVARQADGKAVASEQIGVRISIKAESAFGTLLYQETHSPLTNLIGIFDISIGGGQVQSGDLSSIDWGSGKYFLQLEIDIAGGTNYVNVGVSQLLSVPYALHAHHAQSWRHNQPVVQTGLFQGGGQLSPSGDGPRLIWYPRKAAMAVGYNAGGSWDDVNLGEYSFATGNQSAAKGMASVAMGWQSHADGIYSVAMGEKANAMGDGSVAFGVGTVSKAAGSASFGAFNDAQDNPAPNGQGALMTDRIFQIGNGLNFQSTSNAFTVLRSGHIGIGNASVVPLFPLDIDGRMRLRHLGNTTAGIHFNDSQNNLSGFVGMMSDQKVGFYIGDKWNFQVKDNGDVGIGNNVPDPTCRLDVGGRIRIRHLDNTTAGVHFDNSNNVATGFAGMMTDDEVGLYVGNSWKFWVSAAGKGFMRGKLGVGTDIFDPEFTLDLAGRARIRHTANATAGIYFNDSQNNVSGFVGMISDDKIGFYLGNKWRFKVKSNGYVGIGDDVVDPTHLLDVGGRIRLRHHGNATSGIHFDNSQNNASGFAGMMTDSQIGFYAGNSWKFWVDDVGNGFVRGKLGVGSQTFTPGYALDVDRKIRFRYQQGDFPAIYFDGALFNGAQLISFADTVVRIQMGSGILGHQLGFDFLEDAKGQNPHYVTPFRIDHNGFWVDYAACNTVVANNIFDNSDRNLKRDISPLTRSLSKIQQLNGYHYYWKTGKDQGLQTGVIAQEVEAIFPELVRTDEKGIKSVNYMGLIPHLVESLKALKAENQELMKANVSLDNRLGDLEKRVANMPFQAASLKKESSK